MKKMFKKLQRGVLLAATTFMLVTFTLSTLVACSSGSENESDMGVKETHMVTFNSNGGSEVEAQIVVSGEKAEEPAEPTKDGFLFIGWRDKSGSFFNFDTPIRSNITLTAGWEKTTVPSEPQNVTAKASGFRCIDVSWDAVDGADSYVVYYRLSLEGGEGDSQENGTEATRKTTTNTHITIDYLDEDKKYDFWVIAKNSIGDSGRSDVVSARQYFPAPTGVYADVTGTGYAHVSCNPVRGATGYEIYAQRKDYGFSSEKVFLKSSVSNVYITVGGLASHGHYYFYVKAVCGTKTSDYSSPSRITLIH
ncbi:MAG: hypothetical protein HDR51_06920 [Treponema sp.]|nr:hypothetical protein [Treponema sp.]